MFIFGTNKGTSYELLSKLREWNSKHRKPPEFMVKLPSEMTLQNHGLKNRRVCMMQISLTWVYFYQRKVISAYKKWKLFLKSVSTFEVCTMHSVTSTCTNIHFLVGPPMQHMVISSLRKLSVAVIFLQFIHGLWVRTNV